MKNRRAISEILSAVIIIAVVVSGLGLYVGLSQQRILGETTSVMDAMIQSRDQTQEIIEPFAMFRDDIEPKVIEVYVFNSGLKNVTISNVFVNGTIDMNGLEPAYVKDLNDNRIWPNDKIIPVGNATKIILNFTDRPEPTIFGIENLVIITTSNKFIEIVNDTS